MSLESIGLVLVGFGVAIVVAGGGAPNRGFRAFSESVSAYRLAKTERRRPTLEEEGAYYSYCAYVVGMCLIVCGVAAYFSSFMFGV